MHLTIKHCNESKCSPLLSTSGSKSSSPRISGILKGRRKRGKDEVYAGPWPQRCLHNEAERYAEQARLMECLRQVSWGEKFNSVLLGLDWLSQNRRDDRFWNKNIYIYDGSVRRPLVTSCRSTGDFPCYLHSLGETLVLPSAKCWTTVNSQLFLPSLLLSLFFLPFLEKKNKKFKESISGVNEIFIFRARNWQNKNDFYLGEHLSRFR